MGHRERAKEQKATESYTADDVLAALRLRHPPEAWLYAEEVAYFITPGAPRHLRYVGWGRIIDAFAMALWESRRFERVAYEIKVSRAGFLRELRNPDKRKFAMAFSNRFYFVMPVGIADKREIPDGCGMMIVRQGHARVHKQAPWREIEPWPPGFVASFGRRVYKQALIAAEAARKEGGCR